MKEINIEKEIATLKAEAAGLLSIMSGIAQDTSIATTTRIVDCIVSAAMLEVTNLYRKVANGEIK